MRTVLLNPPRRRRKKANPCGLEKKLNFRRRKRRNRKASFHYTMKRNRTPDEKPSVRSAFSLKGIGMAVPVVLGMTANAFVLRMVSGRVKLGVVANSLLGLVSASVLGGIASRIAPQSAANFMAGATAMVVQDVVFKLREGRMAAPSTGEGASPTLNESVSGQPVLSMTA